MESNPKLLFLSVVLNIALCVTLSCVAFGVFTENPVEKDTDKLVRHARRTKQTKKKRERTLDLQEVQAPPGLRHSDGIVATQGDMASGTSVGLIYFSNDLIVPGSATGSDLLATGTPMGTQSGYCVQVWVGQRVDCFFNFDIDSDDGKGRITAEAHFDLPNFPEAELVITGGSGDFLGIYGSGVTIKPENFDGTTFDYSFKYRIRK